MHLAAHWYIQPASPLVLGSPLVLSPWTQKSVSLLDPLTFAVGPEVALPATLEEKSVCSSPSLLGCRDWSWKPWSSPSVGSTLKLQVLPGPLEDLRNAFSQFSLISFPNRGNFWPGRELGMWSLWWVFITPGEVAAFAIWACSSPSCLAPFGVQNVLQPEIVCLSDYFTSASLRVLDTIHK